MRTLTSVIASIAILFGSFILSSVWTGCADELPTGASDSVIMPLKVGNRWIARATTFNEDGRVLESHLDTLIILGTTSLEGQSSSTWYEGNNGIFYSNRDGGLHVVDTCSCTDAAFPAKYPAQPRDTFNTMPTAKVLIPADPDPIVVDQIIANRVFSTEESIVVPAGTFSCYHYGLDIITPKDARFIQETRRYYAPNIGPVRIDQYQGTGEEGWLQKRWELVEVYLG